MVVGSSVVAVTYTSDLAPASSKEFLDIQVTIERGFTLKPVRDMIRTYSQTVVSIVSKDKLFLSTILWVVKETLRQFFWMATA